MTLGSWMDVVLKTFDRALYHPSSLAAMCVDIDIVFRVPAWRERRYVAEPHLLHWALVCCV